MKIFTFRISTVIKILALLLVITVFIIDIIFDKRLTVRSADLSYAMQEGGGEWLQELGNFFSSWGVYWIVVYFHLYILFNWEVAYMLYIISLYFLPFITTMMLKAIYYRGRPYVIDERVNGCECDPGMPSGHSTMSVMTYWILYEVTKRNLIERLKHYWLRVTLKIVVGVLCILITLSIMISRIILGVHSYPQIIIGTIVALVYCTIFTFHSFTVILHKLRYRIRYIAGGFGIFLLFFIIGMMFLNHYAREQREYWVYFHKCEACMGSFVRGQTETLSVIYFYVFFLMCFGFTGPRVESAEEKEIKKLIKEEENKEEKGIDYKAEQGNGKKPNGPIDGSSNPSPLERVPINMVNNRSRNVGNQFINREDEFIAEELPQQGQPDQNRPGGTSPDSPPDGIIDVEFRGESKPFVPPPKAINAFTFKEHSGRYLIYLALHLPALIILGVFHFIIKPVIREERMNLIGQCFLYIGFYGVGTALLGAGMVGIRNSMFKRAKIYDDNDSIDFPSLLRYRRRQEDEIEVKIDKDLSGHHHTHINRIHKPHDQLGLQSQSQPRDSNSLHHNPSIRSNQMQSPDRTIPQNEINHHSVPADDHPAHPSKSKPVIQNDA